MGLTHNTISCCYEGCYATITLHPDDERRLRRTHEAMYCPAGHVQYFLGKTKEEKLIESLESEVKLYESYLQEAWDESGQIRERLRLVAKAAQTCPLGCGWQGNRRLDYCDRGNDGKFLDRIGSDLADHMAREHGLKVKVVDGRLVAPEAEEAPA